MALWVHVRMPVDVDAWARRGVERGVWFYTGRLYAFDVSNGRERWRYQTAAAIHSTPSISGNLVLVGADDGTVSAIDRASGVRRWQVPGTGEVWASPTVYDDGVYFGRATGQLRWRVQ